VDRNIWNIPELHDKFPEGRSDRNRALFVFLPIHEEDTPVLATNAEIIPAVVERNRPVFLVGRDRSRGWCRLCLSPLAEPAERNYRNGLHRLHSWSGSHTVA
jgi:hypothetical protein